jgi:hypothetical protein
VSLDHRHVFSVPMICVLGLRQSGWDCWIFNHDFPAHCRFENRILHVTSE